METKEMLQKVKLYREINTKGQEGKLSKKRNNYEKKT